MQNLPISQCFLSLASNFYAEQNLALARTLLDQSLPDYAGMKIQAAAYSPIVFSQDKSNSASTSPPLVQVYHNQIVWLSFISPVAWTSLHSFTKSVEQMALRHEFSKPIVSLDIDILAIAPSEKVPADTTMDNSVFMALLPYPHALWDFQRYNQKLPYKWYGIARRFPLARYDRYGINHLLSHQLADNRSILPIL